MYKTRKVKIYMYQYFKRQLKTTTCFGSSGIHPQGVLKVLRWNYFWCFVCVVGVWQREIWTCGVYVCVSGAPSWELMLGEVACVTYSLLPLTVILNSAHQTHTHHRSKFHAANHRLRTQNITSNFSETLLILPEDGSQRIRNISEFLIVF